MCPVSMKHVLFRERHFKKDEATKISQYSLLSYELLDYKINHPPFLLGFGHFSGGKLVVKLRQVK